MNELYDTIAKFLFVLGVLGLLACFAIFIHFWVEERRIKKFTAEQKKKVQEYDHRTRRQAR